MSFASVIGSSNVLFVVGFLKRRRKMSVYIACKKKLNDTFHQAYLVAKSPHHTTVSRRG